MPYCGRCLNVGRAKSHASERRAGLHSCAFATWPVQPAGREDTDADRWRRSKEGRSRQVSGRRQGERAVVAADARCWSGLPLDLKRTQSARIKAPSKAIGDGGFSGSIARVRS
jgi:hypothetical protein